MRSTYYFLGLNVGRPPLELVLIRRWAHRHIISRHLPTGSLFRLFPSLSTFTVDTCAFFSQLSNKTHIGLITPETRVTTAVEQKGARASENS